MHPTPSQSSRPIFHLHIPKTGGQSFGRRLGAAVAPGAAHVMQGDINATDAALAAELARSRRVVSAHVAGPLFALVDAFDVVCLVREPVAHIVSSYLHIMREPAHRLHALVQAMPFAQVFQVVPEWFFNTQALGVVGAFFGRDPADIAAPDDFRFVVDRLFAAADRIRWLAPTEEIDDLTRWVSVATGLPIPDDVPDANRRPPALDGLAAELTAWLRAHPALFALDSLLHVEACRRHAAFRRDTIRALAARAAPVDTAPPPGEVFAQEGRFIRLVEGWWPPVLTKGWGREDRAGPGLTSSVAFRRGPQDRWLVCDLAFVAGNEPHEIVAVDAAGVQRVPVRVSDSESRRSLGIDLAALPEEGAVVLRAARVFPLGLFSRDPSGNSDRIAYSTGFWRFEPAGWGEPGEAQSAA